MRFVQGERFKKKKKHDFFYKAKIIAHLLIKSKKSKLKLDWRFSSSMLTRLYIF